MSKDPTAASSENNSEARIEDLRAGLDDEVRLLQVSKMAEMGVMASSILHEMRQPLFSIKGYVQMLLLESHQSGLPDERLVKIHELIEDLERRAAALLDFSRIPDEGMIPLDVREPVRAAAELFRNRLKKTGVQLHLELATGLPPIQGNYRMLQQVLVNLFQNSLQALEQREFREGRHIWIVSRLSSSPEEVEVMFADSGVGIPDDVQDHVFELFFTTKEHGAGTGLGLTISQEIVNAHFGELCLVDPGEFSEGHHPEPVTVFRLTLPAHGARAPA